MAEVVGEREQEAGVAPSEPGQAAQVAGLLRKPHQHSGPITLRLAPGMGLGKMLELPLAARDDLDQLLRFEMDRLTPFRAEDVIFAHGSSRATPSDGASRSSPRSYPAR